MARCGSSLNQYTHILTVAFHLATYREGEGRRGNKTMMSEWSSHIPDIHTHLKLVGVVGNW